MGNSLLEWLPLFLFAFSYSKKSICLPPINDLQRETSDALCIVHCELCETSDVLVSPAAFGQHMTRALRASTFFGMNFAPETALGLSIVWSLKTCVLSHLSAISSEKKIFGLEIQGGDSPLCNMFNMQKNLRTNSVFYTRIWTFWYTESLGSWKNTLQGEIKSCKTIWNKKFQCAWIQKKTQRSCNGNAL